MSQGYTFERMATDDDALARCAALLAGVFPHASYTAASLRWQYRDNPSGAVIGWNAIAADGTLAAHYALQPMTASVFGATVTGALSLNTATHPQHQGKGLFVKLASDAYETAASEGIDFVTGIANANSTPGFVRRLGFTLVTSLRARVGLNLRASDREPAQFERVWDRKSVAWRAAKPGARYRSIGDTLYAAAQQPLVRAVLGAGPLYRDAAGSSLGVRPFDLWIGLEPGGPPKFGVEIVGRFRPSPLNMIYRSLTDDRRIPEAGSVRFRAADFDAY